MQCLLEVRRRFVAAVSDDDDVYYYICWRLKLEGETENMGVCTKERKGVAAEVLMATPCTNSLGGESEGHKHEGCGGRRLCWKFAAVSWSGADDDVYYYIRWRERETLVGD